MGAFAEMNWLGILRCPSCGSGFSKSKDAVTMDQTVRSIRNYKSHTTSSEIVEDFEARCKCGLLKTHSVIAAVNMLYKDTAENIASSLMDENHLEYVVNEEELISDLSRQVEGAESLRPGTLSIPSVQNLTITPTQPFYALTETSPGSGEFTVSVIEDLSPLTFDMLIRDEMRKELDIPPDSGERYYIVLSWSDEDTEYWILDEHLKDRDFLRRWDSLNKVDKNGLTYEELKHMILEAFPNAHVQSQSPEGDFFS